MMAATIHMPLAASIDGRQTLECRGHNCGKPRRRWQRGDFILLNPSPFAELVVEHRLTSDPAGCKRQDHEMALDAVLLIAHDGLAKAGEGHRLDREARLFADFARHSLVQRLANLDYPAGEAEQAPGRWSGAAHHQHLAVAHDRGAGREVGAVWIASCVVHKYGSMTGASGADADRSLACADAT